MAKDEVTACINTDEAPAAKKQKIATSLADLGDSADLDQIQSNNILENISKAEEEINQIEDEQSLEICKLEQRYVEKKEPVFDKRQSFIEKIPRFWQMCMFNHPQLGCLIADGDLEAMEYLKSIHVDQKLRDEEVVEDGVKYMKSLNHAITFVFNENPFFENAKITKSFYQVMDDTISESTEIKWKEGKNLIDICRAKMENGSGQKLSSLAANEEKKGAEVDAENAKNDKNADDKATAAPGVDPSGDQPADFSTDNDIVDSFFAWFDDHEDAGSDDTSDMIKDDLYIHALNYYISPEDSEEEDEEDVDLEAESDEA